MQQCVYVDDWFSLDLTAHQNQDSRVGKGRMTDAHLPSVVTLDNLFLFCNHPGMVSLSGSLYWMCCTFVVLCI